MGRENPSDLCDVVKEITAALLAGDWLRVADESGSRYYYVVRRKDYDADAQSGHSFSSLFIVPPAQKDSFWDWFIRAALAEEPRDRLGGARARVIAAGGAAGDFDEAMAALAAVQSIEELRVALEQRMDRLLASGGLEALAAVLEATRIERVRNGHVFVSEKDRSELQEALEHRFLKELAERYPKVVKRAVTLEWLSFSDPQLREASRCYLYGFFRATVLIAVAALEQALRAHTGGDQRSKYGDWSIGRSARPASVARI